MLKCQSNRFTDCQVKILFYPLSLPKVSQPNVRNSVEVLVKISNYKRWFLTADLCKTCTAIVTAVNDRFVRVAKDIHRKDENDQHIAQSL